jgi:UDP-N-acetylglucosamine 2-epimerase
MEPTDFLKLLANSNCLIGNSSVGIRECAYLAVPVVNIGTRQNRRQRASNVTDVMYHKEDIKRAINERISAKSIVSETIYGDGNSGDKIADILANVALTFHKTITY